MLRASELSGAMFFFPFLLRCIQRLLCFLSFPFFFFFFETLKKEREP